MSLLSKPIALPRLSGRSLDRATVLSALLMLIGFVTVFVAVHRPLLVVEGLFAALFLLAATRSPLLALAIFFALTFLSDLLGQVAGGSFNPAVLAAKGAGGALVLVWIYRLLAREGRTEIAPAVRVFAVVAAALVIWALSSALWAADPHSAAASAARLAQGPLLVIVIVAFVQTEFALVTLCYVYVAGAALSALAGLTGLIQNAQDGGRLSGGVGDPNFTAAVLVSAVALSLFMALAPGRSRLYRIVMLGLSVLSLVAVFLTQSRGGVVALGVVFVVAIVFGGRARAQIVGVSLVVGSIGLIYLALLAPPHALSRLSDLRAGGGTGRTDLWSIALQVFERHPVKGVGLENFQVVSPIYAVTTDTDLPRADVVVTQGAPTHNTYLQILAELGVVGELLFLGVLGLVLEATRRGVQLLAQRGKQTLELVGRGLFVGTIGMLTAFFFLSAQYEKQLWLTLGLLLAFANVARRPGPVAASPLAPVRDPLRSRESDAPG
jgi:O-antigen ligase